MPVEGGQLSYTHHEELAVRGAELLGGTMTHLRRHDWRELNIITHVDGMTPTWKRWGKGPREAVSHAVLLMGALFVVVGLTECNYLVYR